MGIEGDHLTTVTVLELDQEIDEREADQNAKLVNIAVQIFIQIIW